MGAWIETMLETEIFGKIGLVAPLVGAWIETAIIRLYPRRVDVAPLVGAWIET